ncbi:MAG TPA: MarR family transcriptional regulator [Afipia sp.]
MEPIPAIKEEMGLLVTRVGRLWRRRVDQALAKHGLSQATALPLRILIFHGKPLRQGVLADELDIEGPSLVRLIDLLEAEGLVERREDPTDRRAKMLSLTPSGDTMARQVEQIVRRLRNDILQGISNEHLMTTFEVLRTIERKVLARDPTPEEAVEA